jgi:serine/threonine protein kinase
MLCSFDFLCVSISKYDKPIGSHSYGYIEYMSPETKIGGFERFCFDARASDVYSLGTILFEMIDFNRPFGEIDSMYDRLHVNRQLNRS